MTRLSKIAGHLLPSPVEGSNPLYDLDACPNTHYPDQARNRVANLTPDVVVPISYFDFDAWDKKTKPAGFNVRAGFMDDMPPDVRADVKSRMRAGSKRKFVDTPIYNGRLVKDSMTLDKAGCCCEEHITQMEPEDFYDIQKVHKVYFPECIDYVKRMTGATKVMPFDHSVRNKVRMLKDPNSGIGAYANGAHNDNTLWSGPKRCRELIRGTPEFKEEVYKYRYAVMNVWKRWDGGNDMSLAVCSGDSMSPYESDVYKGNMMDLVENDLVYKNRTGATYGAVYNPNQTMFWFPNMTKDESIILKIYDSESVGNTTTRAPPLKPTDPAPIAKWTLHTAFEHPDFSHDKGTEKECRQSMEVRCLVIWAPEELAKQVKLRGVTGLSGGSNFYDPETGKYVDALADGESADLQANMPNPGAHEADYERFRVFMKDDTIRTGS